MPTGVYPRPSVADRFWSKVQKADECWMWDAARTRWGYGYFYADGRLQHAHRVAFELVRGPIARDLEIDHLCRVKACVNPAHLEPVTGTENRRREMADRERVRACPRGHAYTPENTYTDPRGGRRCRMCMRALRRRKP